MGCLHPIQSLWDWVWVMRGSDAGLHELMMTILDTCSLGMFSLSIAFSTFTHVHGLLLTLEFYFELKTGLTVDIHYV